MKEYDQSENRHVDADDSKAVESALEDMRKREERVRELLGPVETSIKGLGRIEAVGELDALIVREVVSKIIAVARFEKEASLKARYGRSAYFQATDEHQQ